jgi:hypothetical protein
LRSFYGMDAVAEKPDTGSERRVRLFLQLAVIVFWLPSAGMDLLLLWRDHTSEGVNFAFWLLFRQSLVFLALWFTVSISHGLMRGRRTKEPTRRQRRAARNRIAQVATFATPGRFNRGQ